MRSEEFFSEIKFRLCSKFEVSVKGIFDRPINARLTEYKDVITRIPDKSGCTFSLVFINPVKAPAKAPATNTTGIINTGEQVEIKIAVTAPPRVNEPSVVISGILNIRMDI
jgi:hypothetical protein